jgi:surface antigen
MESGWGWTLVWGVLVALASVMPIRRTMAGSCVLFARAETGVGLVGNADAWWNEAAGLYQRGHVPEVGSILVFEPTGFMPLGHVAVVSKVIGPGQILVDQSNWYHGRTTYGTPVIDTSSERDWSQVAVMNIGAGEFGRDSPTYGFIYPDTGTLNLVALGAAGSDLGFAKSTAFEPGAGGNLFHFTANDDNWQAQIRDRVPVDFRHRRRWVRRRGPRRWAARAGEHSPSASGSGHHAWHGLATHAAAVKKRPVADTHRSA